MMEEKQTEWYPLRGDGRALLGRPFFEDARLNAQLAASEGAMWCAKDGIRCVALPYAPQCPFPLVELFCLARVETVCGRECVVYCADAAGVPIMPSIGTKR